MKSRILSIAIALSMLAVVYVAVPMSAAVYYTGSVQTTDENGDAKTVFFVNPGVQGDNIYVAVELLYQGDLYNQSIMVVLYDSDGNDRDWFYADTGVTSAGVYDSWEDAPINSLHVPASITGGQLMVVCDVVVYVDDGGWWIEFASTQVIVKQEGLYMDPSSWIYYPGEEVTVTVITRETQDFYIEVVNDTGEAMETFLNIETSEGYYSFVWVVNDVPDGYYYMYVRAEIDDDIWMTDSFYIQMYDFNVYTDRYMVLLGETVEMAYEVVELATETVYADVTIEWNAMWYNESGNETRDDGTLAENAGVFEFTIPDTNIATWSYVYLTMWANGTDGDRSVEWSTYFSIGWLAGDVYVDDDYYYPGDTVTVSTDAWVEDTWGSWNYLPGADVEVVVTFNGTEIAGYGKVGTTDSQGNLEYEFDLMVGAERGSYLVTATISKVGYEIVRMTAFQVSWTGYLDITTDRDTYLSGELARFSFTAIWNDEEYNATPVHYTVWDTYSWTPVGSGDAVTGTDAMFQIPDDFTGELYVEAEANLDGVFLYGSEYIDVVFASMALSPAADTYTPGDTISWLFEVMTVSANGTLSYSIEDDEGNEVGSGSMALVPSGTLSYHVSAMSTSSWYMATLTFDAGDSWVMDRSSTIYRTSAYDVSIWMNSDSKFVSGAFEPGSEMNFGFEIIAYEEEEPRMYRLDFYVSGSDSDYVMFTSAGEGEFAYQIPDDSQDGWYGVWVDMYDAVTGQYLGYDYVEFEVQADQSTWDRSVGGMSLIDFTILLLIVLMIVLLILVPFLKGRMSAQPKTEKFVEAPAPPPPEQGKSPPA